MTLFWALGAALAALVLVLLLRPLLFARRAAGVSRDQANVAVYRDQLRELDADLAAGKLLQADYERSRAEVEARLLEDVREGESAARGGARRGLAPALAVAVPLLAVGVYLAVGNPGAIESPQHDLQAMAERLAAHLKTSPDDAQGWALLGRSYAALGRFPESVEAYSQAALRSPRDADLLADFADALAMARGQSLQGPPEELVRRALEIDPKNMKALALAGTAAFDRRDFNAAVAYWKQMLEHVQPGTEDERIIRQSIDEALALASARPLTGTVRLAPSLKEKVSPGDTVFIYARAAEGPPMPLAAKRIKAGELPATFSLDDAMAMAPEMKLSAHPRVVVTARVSKSGQAAPQPGDLQGASAPVANDATGVTVIIDTLVR
jgi:cytochrome c-type biogenesis protein CcmH